MAWLFCTSNEAIAKAGTHANASIIVDSAALASWSDEAEGSIEQDTNTDWTTTYNALSNSIKGALKDITSSRIAKVIVSYDPIGYLTREADMLMNMNDDIEVTGLKKIRGKADKIKTP